MAEIPAQLVIVGAGAAGSSCAIAAANLGADVVLLEQSSEIGGTVTHALIHTLGGLFDDQGNCVNHGLTDELIVRLCEFCVHTVKRQIGKTWTLSVDPGVYLNVIKQWITEYPNIKIYRKVAICEVLIDNESTNKLIFNSPSGLRILRPSLIIDASGCAAIVRSLKQNLVIEGEAMAGLIIQIRGVAPDALQFPNGIGILYSIRKAVEDCRLPTECGSIWLDRGVTADEAYAKFNLMATQYDLNHMKDVAFQLLSFLQTMPSFANAYISDIGSLGIRDGGQVLGDYYLTESDIRNRRHFDDAVCDGCWPIEYWHPENGVSLHYFPPGHRYQIPLRALKIKGFNSLYVAGKCFSAEPMVLASARVVGTCWAMGDGLIKHLCRSS